MAGPDHAGHTDHADRTPATLRDRFWILLLLTIPTLIWSDLFQRWFHYTVPEFGGWAYLPLIFGVAVFLYGGRIFLQGAALRGGGPDSEDGRAPCRTPQHADRPTAYRSSRR